MTTSSTISVQDLHRQNTNAKQLMIDVRTLVEVQNECYAGCVNLPLQDLDVAKLKAAVDADGCRADAPVFLVCGSGMRAQKAVAQLAESISNPLVVVTGGVNAMKAAGIPLLQGESSIISLERQVRIAAGALVLLGVIVGAFVTPLGYGLSASVGAGLMFAGVVDNCVMGMLIARMPWNSRV